MKYILAVAIALAAMSCVLAHPGRGPRLPDGGIFGCARYLQSNATVKAAFISALNDAGFSQCVVNGTSVNYTCVNQNFYSIIQASAIQTFINTYVVPKWPDISTILSTTLSVIQNLQNNATVISEFTGYLLIAGFSSYVSCSAGGSFSVNYDSVEGDVRASQILNAYILKATRDILYPRRLWDGPYGRF